MNAATGTVYRRTKPVNLSPSAIARFWKYASRAGSNECWLWKAYRNPDGYGTLGVGGVPLFAHRISWTIHFGPIPNGLCALHDCPSGDNPACVNPAHLWLGTVADNNADMRAKGRGRYGLLLGEGNTAAKIGESQVREIRLRRKSGEVLRLIAKDYSLGITEVWNIANFKTWKSVK